VIAAAVLNRHANRRSSAQHLWRCGILLVYGDAVRAAVGVVLDDSTKMGWGDEGVQLEITEARPNHDPKAPARTDGQADCHGGQDSGTDCDE